MKCFFQIVFRQSNQSIGLHFVNVHVCNLYRAPFMYTITRLFTVSIRLRDEHERMALGVLMVVRIFLSLSHYPPNLLVL